MITSIQLENFLSFGSEAQTLELKPLNVVIGPNGSGKSNLIEALRLLNSAPSGFDTFFSRSQSIPSNWIWRGNPKSIAGIGFEFDGGKPRQQLSYEFHFAGVGLRSNLIAEALWLTNPKGERRAIVLSDARGRLIAPKGRKILRLKGEFSRSILVELRDPTRYPELELLRDACEAIRFYSDANFGRRSSLRSSQPADLPRNVLLEDGTNLPIVLSRLFLKPGMKQKFAEAVRQVYGPATDLALDVVQGTLELVFTEQNWLTPASRMSDGTMRWVFLLALLMDTEFPATICIEEPELGLHPDAIPAVAEALQEASKHHQLIVTTHSEHLVDCFSDRPESIVVCEKEEGQTKLQRLSKKRLAHWLKKYRLGQIWRSGEIGGNRW